jgi:hypothetical protein
MRLGMWVGMLGRGGMPVNELAGVSYQPEKSVPVPGPIGRCDVPITFACAGVLRPGSGARAGAY